MGRDDVQYSKYCPHCGTEIQLTVPDISVGAEPDGTELAWQSHTPGVCLSNQVWISADEGIVQ